MIIRHCFHYRPVHLAQALPLGTFPTSCLKVLLLPGLETVGVLWEGGEAHRPQLEPSSKPDWTVR